MASPSSGDVTPDARSLDREGYGEEEANLNPNLPNILIEGILARLPFLSLVRFCSVSKWWRDLILSSEDFPRCSGHGCLAAFNGKPKFTAFNSTRRSWDAVPMQFLQRKWMIVSAGGLLCFRTGELLPFQMDEDCEFILCNPLTKCSKRVPLPCEEGMRVTDQPRMSIPDSADSRRILLIVSFVLGMVVDHHTGHFKLIVGKFIPGFQGTTLVYDSHPDSWNKAADIPEGVFRYFNHRSQPTTFTGGGNLYFYFGGPRDELLKYQVEEQSWSWIDLPEHETNRYVEKSRNIVDRNGDILLVTPTYVLREIDQMIQMTFQVLKLQDAGWGDWLPTNSLPLCRVREEMPVGTQIDCFGHGDVMFLVRRNVKRHLDPRKISVRKWFHDVTTSSDVISDWVDYQVEMYKESPDFHIFVPSTLLLTEGGGRVTVVARALGIHGTEQTRP